MTPDYNERQNPRAINSSFLHRYVWPHSIFARGGRTFPKRPNDEQRYEHEEYSAAIIRNKLKDVIEHHPSNDNYKIKADEIAALLEVIAEKRDAL